MASDQDPVAACVRVLQRHGVTEVFLFGSRAKARHRPNSDVDLAARGLPVEGYFRLLNELVAEAGVEVDLVDLDRGGLFAKHIEEKIERGWAIRVS